MLSPSFEDWSPLVPTVYISLGGTLARPANPDMNWLWRYHKQQYTEMLVFKNQVTFLFVVGGHYVIEHACETYQVESWKCFEHATNEGDVMLTVFVFYALL